MRVYSLGVSLLLSLLSCEIADPAGVALKCDDGNPCPEGRQCTDGQCSELSDLSVQSDASSTNDLTAAPDLADAPGCQAGNGVRLGTGQWRCPGMFGGTSPKASDLCSVGFTLCAALDATALAACNAAAGFFASPVIGSRKDLAPAGTGQCDQRELFPVVYGCGANGLAASTVCSGYPKLIDCQQQVGVWTCGTTLDGTTNRNPSNGVLCCR